MAVRIYIAQSSRHSSGIAWKNWINQIKFTYMQKMKYVYSMNLIPIAIEVLFMDNMSNGLLHVHDEG